MKIVLYIDSMCKGGAQRVMANLADHLVEKEEVILINDYKQDTDEPQYTVNECVRRLYLKNELSGNILIKNAQRIAKLRKIVREENPDVILSFMGRPNIRMAIATLGLSVKKIISVRNDPNREYGKNPIKKRIVNVLFGLLDGCVFQTEEAKKYFSKKIQDKSRTIYNPVKHTFFETKRKNMCNNIVTFGRLEPQKNHRLLIAAFSQLADEFQNVNLIIYGEGPLKSDLECLIRKLELDGRVILAGNTNHVAEELSKALVFVLSSDYEGMPNALMEAMAMGVPCIATDCPCGGPHELIRDKTDGILIPCQDEVALSEAIRDLIVTEDKRDAYGLHAKQRAQMFKPQLIYQEWDDYFDYVLHTDNE